MSNSMPRRDFLRTAAAISAGATLAEVGNAGRLRTLEAPDGVSWPGAMPDRVWLGPELWANPLQDWKVESGAIVCINPASDRNVHVLTRELGDHDGVVSMSVMVSRPDGSPLGEGPGSFGFRIGIQGPLPDPRNRLIFGAGLNAGLTRDGLAFVGDPRTANAPPIDLSRVKAVRLDLNAEPEGTAYRVQLAVSDAETGDRLGEVERSDIAAGRLVGNLALVANFRSAGQASAPAKTKKAGQPSDGVAPSVGNGTFAYRNWSISGTKVKTHSARAFGPILFSQYTLSLGLFKLTAQMPPIGAKDEQTVRLQIQESNDWKTVADAPIDPESRTATFRVEAWDASRDVPYRLVYQLMDSGEAVEHEWTGTVRRDPDDRPVLTVADVSCNFHSAFPNAEYVESLAKLAPDLIAFTGDQFYESSGGYGIIRGPVDLAILDYLRKWYLHGWTWRNLTRDRPSISIPDDHDVYQGNLWGESGSPRRTTQEAGGYDMPPAWVNVVHRTQTSHHPDPFDSTPGKQGISVYYGAMVYGKVSFAILADRQFKSGPEGKVPPTGSRGDHVVDPQFDPDTADLPGLELLGDRQVEFLRKWAEDWTQATLKAVISQTIFTAMATTHGPERQRLRADYDTNGWPQAARNEVLRILQATRAVHIAGDQHLPAVVHYGIEAHRDGPVAFAGPAVNVGYPRWWEPEQPGANRPPGAPETHGDFIDSFGHPLTVYAVANGELRPQGSVLDIVKGRASGLGLVRINRPRRTITFECWPYGANVEQLGTQFPGWPVTVNEADNDGRTPVGRLPRIQVQGAGDPVVLIKLEPDGRLVRACRSQTAELELPVFEPGTYSVTVQNTRTGRSATVRGLQPTDDENTLIVDLSQEAGTRQEP